MKSMILKTNFSPVRLKGLFKRFLHYSLVGTSTYAFDLALIYVFKNFLGLTDGISVALGFIIAVSTNFLISYYWVYKGTEQRKLHGYMFFVGLAIAGLFIITFGTLFLQAALGIGLYTARTLVGLFVGTANFLLNTFFNFKMTH